MAKYLIALDQSTSCTGFAIFQNRNLIAHGCVQPKEKDYLVRIYKLKEWLKRILDNLGTDVEVAIEDIQLQEFEPNSGKRSKDFGVTTYKKLAHVQGALLSLLIEKNIQYHIVPSSTWKKTCKVLGKVRDEQKKNAQNFILNTYKIQATQDEADAICIGHHILNAEAGFIWS